MPTEKEKKDKLFACVLIGTTSLLFALFWIGFISLFYT